MASLAKSDATKIGKWKPEGKIKRKSGIVMGDLRYSFVLEQVWNEYNIEAHIHLNQRLDKEFCRNWNYKIAETNSATTMQIFKKIDGKKYTSITYLANIDFGPDLNNAIETLRGFVMLAPNTLAPNTLVRQDLCAIRLKNINKSRIIIVTCFMPARTWKEGRKITILEPASINITVNYFDEPISMDISIGIPKFDMLTEENMCEQTEEIMKEVRKIDSFFA